MGRPSKLTEAQWAAIIQRADQGEPQKALAEEFGVSPAAVSKVISKASKSIALAVNATIEGERLMATLTPAERTAAEGILDSRRTIMGFVTSSAVDGAAVQARLALIGRRRAETIPVGVELTDGHRQAIQDVGILAKAGNEAGAAAMRLIEADLKRERPPTDEFDEMSDAELEAATEEVEAELVRLGYYEG